MAGARAAAERRRRARLGGAGPREEDRGEPHLEDPLAGHPSVAPLPQVRVDHQDRRRGCQVVIEAGLPAEGLFLEGLRVDLLVAGLVEDRLVDPAAAGLGEVPRAVGLQAAHLAGLRAEGRAVGALSAEARW